MHSIHGLLNIFTAPSQSGEPLVVQALVGLIALVIFVRGAHGLSQWKTINSGRKVRYILLVALSSVVFLVSLHEVYYGFAHGQNRGISGSYSYSVQCATGTSVYDHPVSECSTLTK